MGKEIIRTVSASILKRIIVHTAKKWATGRENVSRGKKKRQKGPKNGPKILELAVPDD